MDKDIDSIILEIINEKHFLFSEEFVREIAKRLLLKENQDISDKNIEEKIKYLKRGCLIYRKINGFIIRGKIGKYPEGKELSNVPILYYLPDYKNEVKKFYLKKIGVDAIPAEDFEKMGEIIKKGIKTTEITKIKLLIDSWIEYMPKVCWDGVFYYCGDYGFKPYTPDKPNIFEFLWMWGTGENFIKHEQDFQNYLLDIFKKYVKEPNPFILMEEFRKKSVKFWREKKKLNEKLNEILIKTKWIEEEGKEIATNGDRRINYPNTIIEHYPRRFIAINVPTKYGWVKKYLHKFGVGQIRIELYSRLWDEIGEYKKLEFEDIRSFLGHHENIEDIDFEDVISVMEESKKIISPTDISKYDIDGCHYNNLPYSEYYISKIFPKKLNKRWLNIFKKDGAIREEILAILEKKGCIENVRKLQDILMDLKETKNKVIETLKFYDNSGLEK